MKPDPDLDQICRELTEWMDGWRLEKRGDASYIVADSFGSGELKYLMKSLDFVREIEVAVIELDLDHEYQGNLWDIATSEINTSLDELNMAMADPKPRLIALHRTLDEANEINQDGGDSDD